MVWMQRLLGDLGKEGMGECEELHLREFAIRGCQVVDDVYTNGPYGLE
jgi:hypothetical protein